MTKRYTYQDVKKYIESYGYKLLSDEYINNKKPLRIKCSEGHEYNVSFSSFKNKQSRCPYCNGNAKYTYEEVKEYVESFGYELLSNEYINANGKLKTKCPKGHVWITTFDRFKRDLRCKKCANEKLKENKMYTYEEVREYVESFGYELLSNEYIGSNEYIIVKPPCGHEAYKVTFAHFKNGNRCKKCANEKLSEKKRLDYESVKKYIEGFNYKLLSKEYTNAHQLLKIKCSKDHIYNTTFNNFKNGKRCPICNETKGEKEVSRVLDKLNIKYNSQYKFEDCKAKRYLPFDFYLPDYNCCIEFDGEQHFEIVKWFGGLDGFIGTVIRDTIKNEYCKKNNIKLIRIPYQEFNNIERIIVNELNLK